MVRITEAVAAHKAAGLPYLVYLRHPDDRRVMASWGPLGHVTVGEPGALIGFLGPRVYEALYGKPFPEGVQTAENPTPTASSTRSCRRRRSPASSTARSPSCWPAPG